MRAARASLPSSKVVVLELRLLRAGTSHSIMEALSRRMKYLLLYSMKW